MKVLLLRFSSIGDVVLTTPIIRSLRKRYPEAEIHFATKKAFAPLLEPNPYLDKVWRLEGDDRVLINDLKRERYNWILDLHKNLRTARIKAALGVKSLSFDKLNVKKWLAVNLKLDVLPQKHLIDRYYEGFKQIDINYDGMGLDFFFKEEIVAAELLPESFRGTEYVAIAIGANHNTKRMPQAKLKELIAGLCSNVVLLGGSKEKTDAEELMMAYPHRVVHGCGKWSLAESAAVIKSSSALITPDTGMMHIGAALGKPVFSVWGSTVPEFGMYPLEKADVQIKPKIFQVEGLGCRPCSKLGYAKCPKGHFKCMLQQDMSAIAEQANQLLA